MKAILVASAALTAIISAGVFAGNLSDEAVDITTVETANLEATTVAAPCEAAIINFEGDIVLEKATKAKFASFCTKRMFQRAKKIPKEEFIWSVYDMQRAAGQPLTPLDRLTATFNSIDRNNDKVINMKELNRFTSVITRPTLNAKGCGTCGSGKYCNNGCHCHGNGSCGKNGDLAGFKTEGGIVKQ